MIVIANIKDLGSILTVVRVGSGELLVSNDQLMISLSIVFMPKLVNKTANIISTAMEKNPPVAVLN